MESTLKRLQEAEQENKELSQQKHNVEQTNIDLEARFKELQVCFAEQQKINKNHQKEKTTLKLVLFCVCFILLNVIISRLVGPF